MAHLGHHGHHLLHDLPQVHASQRSPLASTGAYATLCRIPGAPGRFPSGLPTSISSELNLANFIYLADDNVCRWQPLPVTDEGR